MARGRLRVLLGAAPGVGKTYAMLETGHTLLGEGADVVVGYLEDHGRAATRARAEGLEVVPRRPVRHRGRLLEEMDLEAVLARAPEVALVDELAHTNAPGSRHAKRWQDVEDLLAAGIDVVTTVNIQHLESLNDAVTAVTGVVQRETLPDRVVRSAAEVELVDLTPEALRRRLEQGLVYRPARADEALRRYFRPGNLAALRELALLWLADRVGEGLDRYRADHGIEGTWPTRDRVVVAVSGGPEGRTLIRRGARIVGKGAGGVLHVVYVVAVDGLTSAPVASVDELRRLTEELGGSFHIVTAADPAEGVLAFSRAVNAAQVVVGSSRRPWWRRVVSGGACDAIIAGSGEMDVHVVTHDLAGRGAPVRPGPPLAPRRVLLGWVLALCLPVLVTPALLSLPEGRGLPLVVLVHLLATVVVAMVGGVWPAVASALLGSLLVNWFHTPPLREFTIADPVNVLALVVYVAIAGLVSAMVHRSARRAATAEAAETEVRAMLDMTPILLGAQDQLASLLDRAVELAGVRAAALVHVPAEGGEPTVVASTPGTTEAVLHPEDAGSAVEVRPVGAEHRLALEADGPLAAPQHRLLAALAVHAEAVLEQRVLREEARATEELARDNRARRVLLSAVSHDLRSPLAAIKAASGSLRSHELELAPEDREELQQVIEESSDRLGALVDNLLDSSRLQFGAVAATCVPVHLGDVVGALPPSPAGRDAVRTELAPDATTVLADAGLLERVLGNLVDNALRHQPGDGQVVLVSRRVVAEDGSPAVEVAVVDRGPGVDAAVRERMFEPFQRVGDVPDGEGVGLGLSVARGFAEEMRGTLTARDTPGGGLTMVLTLPAPEEVR